MSYTRSATRLMSPRKRLLVVAASGLAREAVEAARAQTRYDVLGILDDNPATHGAEFAGATVLGGLDIAAALDDTVVVVCVGQGSAREAIVHRMALPTTRYATIVHPASTIGRSCVVGPGSVVLAGCVITASATLGDHVVVMPNVTITHDDRIEDFVTICSNVSLGGGARVGTRAYLGMSSVVREFVRVGADAVVGMGSVVLDDVPPGTTVGGVPARRLLPRRRVATG